MYKYLNLHPKDLLIGDCVKRSIAMAANMEYATVQRELNKHKKVTGAKAFNENGNPDSYVKNVLQGEKIVFSKNQNMTGAGFCEEHPKGNYILDMGTHWTACVDGVIYDTWNCSGEQVEYAYKITPKEYNKTFQCEWIAEKSNFQITVCDADRSVKKKKVGINELAGYKECLRDFGYHEILL